MKVSECGSIVDDRWALYLVENDRYYDGEIDYWELQRRYREIYAEEQRWNDKTTTKYRTIRVHDRIVMGDTAAEERSGRLRKTLASDEAVMYVEPLPVAQTQQPVSVLYWILLGPVWNWLANKAAKVAR